MGLVEFCLMAAFVAALRILAALKIMILMGLGLI